MNASTILIIDDEKHIRETMQIALDDELHASVKLQVRMGAPVLPASRMVS